MTQTLKHGLRMILSLVAALSISCSSNVYSDLATPDSDEALLAEADKLINQQKYTEAIAKLSQVSAKSLAKRDYQITYAAAEAGACGLNFINFFSRISDADTVGGSGLFSFLMGGFANTKVNASYCADSMGRMRTLAGSDRIGDTDDDKLFITILSMALMGAVLAEKADINNADGTGDGSIDATFDICSDVADEDIEDEMVAELLSSFGMLTLNIGGLAGGDAVVSSVEDFASSCDSLKSDPSDPNPCAATEPDAVGATEIAFLRKLLHSEGYSLGTSCDTTDAGTFAATCCP